MKAAVQIPSAADIQARLGPNLREYFPEAGGQQAGIELAEVTQRNYSCLFLFRISLNGSDGARGVAVKVFLPASGGAEAARLQFAALKAAWPAFRGCPSVTIPRPLDYFPEFCAIVTESIHGRPLQQLFRQLPLWMGSDAELVRLTTLAGQWLARFHETTARPAGFLDVDDKMTSARNSVHRLGNSGFGREICESVISCLEGSAERLRGQELAMAAVHGDFTVDNVLFDGRRVIAIDLGGKHYNAVYHDIASFLNSLALIGLTWPMRHALLNSSQQGFVSGYFGGAASNREVIRFLRLAGLVSVALEIFDRRRNKLLFQMRARPYLERLFREMATRTAG